MLHKFACWGSRADRHRQAAGSDGESPSAFRKVGKESLSIPKGRRKRSGRSRRVGARRARDSIVAGMPARNRGPAELDARAVELRRSEASGCRLLVAIGQSERRVAVALDVGLRRLSAKLLGAQA